MGTIDATVKTIELMRHTANDGDVLTPAGVAAAIEIGRNLAGGYSIVASSGAQRATQTASCILAGLAEPVPGGVVVIPALRSTMEDRWRAAYESAGAGDLRSLQRADAELVETDSKALAAGLRALFSMLEDGERALAVGHSPTNEGAVYGLTGELIEPMGKGALVVLVEEDEVFSVA